MSFLCDRFFFLRTYYESNVVSIVLLKNRGKYFSTKVEYLDILDRMKYFKIFIVGKLFCFLF